MHPQAYTQVICGCPHTSSLPASTSDGSIKIWSDTLDNWKQQFAQVSCLLTPSICLTLHITLICAWVFFNGVEFFIPHFSNKHCLLLKFCPQLITLLHGCDGRVSEHHQWIWKPKSECLKLLTKATWITFWALSLSHTPASSIIWPKPAEFDTVRLHHLYKQRDIN